MKSAALLTIKKPGALSPAGRKEIVAWLRKQATNLSKYGKIYNDTGNFTARFGYRE